MRIPGADGDGEDQTFESSFSLVCHCVFTVIGNIYSESFISFNYFNPGVVNSPM